MRKITLVTLVILAILATAAPAASDHQQSPIITYYDGQKITAWLQWGIANYDGPAKELIYPGPYPYEFNLTKPLHIYLQIRHSLWRPGPGKENYLTIYLDDIPVLEANTIGLDWYPSGDGVELIDLGTVPAGTHYITMSATSSDFYAMDWFMILELVETPYEVSVGNTRFSVSIVSGSTISNLMFDETFAQDSRKGLISFDATGPISIIQLPNGTIMPTGTIGFINITIPTSLMRGTPWFVSLNQTTTPEDLSTYENGTHTSLYFTYRHNTHIEISGTWAVPEFPSTLILPLLVIVTLIAVILKKKLWPVKHRNNNIAINKRS